MAQSHTPILTPTISGKKQRLSDFQSFSEALDYAASTQTGINFFDAHGNLEQSLTYKQVRDRAHNIARSFLSAGLKRNERVGIVAQTHPDFICAFFACQYAGLLAVPLPSITGLGGRYGYEKQLTAIMKSAQMRITLGPENLITDLEKAAANADIDCVFIGELSTFEQTFKPKAQPLQPYEKDDISHIQYSSGSTRNPSGIIISQKSLMANAYSVANHGLKFTPLDRVASWLPFYHDMGLIGFLMIPVTSQMSIDYINTDNFARRPLLWLELIARNKATISFSPSFGYELCTRRIARKNEPVNIDLSHWRAAGIGGEMVQPEAIADFAKTFAQYGYKPETFVPSYGLAEMTLAFSFCELNKGVIIDSVDKTEVEQNHNAKPADKNTKNIRHFASCGYPMPGYDVSIRDESDNELGERQIGIVYIKGPAIMDGYYRDKASTNAIMKKDGWMNTGDMGYIYDGQLVITGRQKDLIIIHGKNIWPQDIEWHVENTIENIRKRDTAAFALADNDGKEQAAILVHTRVSDPEKREQLRQDIKATIYQNIGIKCKIVLIPPSSLPFTTSGKLSRTKAKQGYLKGDLKDVTER